MYNRGNLMANMFLPNNRVNYSFNNIQQTWDDKIYPAYSDPLYDKTNGIPMMGSLNGFNGTFFNAYASAYPGLCNPPMIFPDAVPGPADSPTPLLGYLPGIPPHEPGGIVPYYTGWYPDGIESGGGQQYGRPGAFYGNLAQTDGLAVDFDYIDSLMGGNGEERFLDITHYDVDEEGTVGEALVDYKKGFSFWANTGQLPTIQVIHCI